MAHTATNRVPCLVHWRTDAGGTAWPTWTVTHITRNGARRTLCGFKIPSESVTRPIGSSDCAACNRRYKETR